MVLPPLVVPVGTNVTCSTRLTAPAMSWWLNYQDRILGMGSSCPVIFDEQVIRGHQTLDPDLQFHFMLHKQIIPSLPDKCQVNISTHIYNDLICTYLKNGRRALVAPKKLQAVLIFLAHNNAGHLSGKYTYDQLAHNWYWPSIQADIENYCRSCHDCARIKPPSNFFFFSKLSIFG